MDCVFCELMTKEFQGRKLHENDTFIAVLDLNPISIGHTLIIPKRHSDNMMGMTDIEREEALAFAHLVAEKILEVTKSDGFNLIHNNGKASGQTVYHTHFHIIPRKHGDGLPMVEFPCARGTEEYFATTRASILKTFQR